MAQALFDEHPLGEYLRGLFFPMHWSSIGNISLLADNGEIPLLIPGTYPASEQELIDFSTGFDENSDGYRNEWPPQFLLDFIEVSLFYHILSLVSALQSRRYHNICIHCSL